MQIAKVLNKKMKGFCKMQKYFVGATNAIANVSERVTPRIWFVIRNYSLIALIN